MQKTCLATSNDCRLDRPLHGRFGALALPGLVAVFALVAILTTPGNALAADRNPLVVERWKTRPIVVVVPTVQHPLVDRVEASLKQTATREGFIERDMVLYTVQAGKGRRNDVPLGQGSTRALLAALKLDAAGPPKFVLVGKDGGVKMIEGENVSLDAVFAEIDRMPMRRR